MIRYVKLPFLSISGTKDDIGAVHGLEAGGSGEDAGDNLPPWLLRTYTDKKIRLPEPSEEELREILAAIGKREPSDELNCGACGYDSCRDKARAVYQGVAESEMCMLICGLAEFGRCNASIPNGIVVADDELSILP